MKKKYLDLRQQARVAEGIMSRRVLTGPWTVQIDLTNRCNNDCIACWCNSPLLDDKGMPEELQDATLSYETLTGIVDELSTLGVRSIYFTGGGEPFMHPRILDLIEYIKGKGIHLDMSSNFTLVDKPLAREIVKLRLDHMNLSLWAGTREVYAKQHPNKSEETFDKITEVVDFIYALKGEYGQTVPGLGMYNVINILNYRDIYNMLEYAFAHRMDHVHFTHVDIIPDRTEDLKLTAEDLKVLYNMSRILPELVVAMSLKYGHKSLLEGFDTFLRRTNESGAESANYDTDFLSAMTSCYAGWSFARILANGDVNSCLKSFKIPIGNIYESSFKEIWYSEKQEEFRAHTIDYDPADPYFLNMGNDMTTINQGCHKCCDNLGLNLSIQERLDKLGLLKRKALNILRHL